ncbi:MAG: type II secretion system minor pseudopilin GspK [Steroidobacteraceae bacterium]
MRRPGIKQQSGVALITALIVLAIATALAVAIGYDSALTARRSVASISLEQSVAIAQGAEALAAYVLQEGKNDPADTPSGRWATPVLPLEVAPDVTIEAQLIDETGKFNLNTLLDANGDPDKDAVMVFTRLLELSQVETHWAALLVDWLDQDDRPAPEGGEDSLYTAQMPPYRPLNRPITSVSELEQLPGFGHERYLKLLPHVTALPPMANTINVCTADGYVLDALNAVSVHNPNEVQYSKMEPEQLAMARTGACFPPKSVLADEPKIKTRISEKSQFFQLRTWVRIGFAEFALYSLMYRDSAGQVRPVMRTFGTE